MIATGKTLMSQDTSTTTSRVVMGQILLAEMLILSKLGLYKEDSSKLWLEEQLVGIWQLLGI
jgi:hypothetical protein